jgi:hypothetical protein
MPMCQWCGNQMIVLKRSTSGIRGGGGARYRCPLSPHPKCPTCHRSMHRDFCWNGSRLVYRDDKWHCRHCEQIMAQTASEIPFSKPPDSVWEFKQGKT